MSWQEDHSVEQYLDGCWYVIDLNEFMVEDGLIAGPFVTEASAWAAYYTAENDFYEWAAGLDDGRDFSYPYEP